MKVTTVRFSEDLWETITSEAEIAGVSASQFIREAALARAAAAAGAREEMSFLRLTPTTPSVHQTASQDGAAPTKGQLKDLAVTSAVNLAKAADIRSESRALRAESQQAVRLSSKLRDRRTKRPTRSD
jgi:uncharacterized protein (DUF1778 family)